MANRIAAAVALLGPRVEALDSEKRAIVDKAARFDFEMWTVAQDHKSLAQADGRLSYDEAVTIYGILGSGPDEFNRAGLAERMVVTQLLGELMKRARRVA